MCGEGYEDLFPGSSEPLKRMIWGKARVIEGHDPEIYREDSCGRKIRYTDLDTFGDFSWRICFSVPISRGGLAGADNFIPQHWQSTIVKNSQILIIRQMAIFDG